MKLTTISTFFALLIIFSCNSNSGKEQSKQDSIKKDITNIVISENQEQENIKNFVSNFEQNTLPYTLDKDAGLYKNFSKLKYVEPKYLNILGISTEGKLSKDEKGVLHYSTDYFYKAYIKTDKNFDLFILAEYPYPPQEAPYIYKLYTVLPDDEKIIDKIEIGFFNSDESGDNESTLATIKNDLNIEYKQINSANKIGNDEVITTEIDTKIKDYKINPNGTFTLGDSILFKSQDVKNIVKSSSLLMSYAEKFKNCNSAYQIKEIIDSKDSILAEFNFLKCCPVNNYSTEELNNKIYKQFPLVYIMPNGEEEGRMQAEFNYYPLYQKALQTPEKDDDVFFEALNSVYKIEDYYQVKILNDWNLYNYSDFYGAYSLFGNDNYLNAFKGIKQALAKETIFKDNIYNLEYILFVGLLNSTDFGSSKEKITDYLEKIGVELSFPEDKETEYFSYFNDFVAKIQAADNSHFNKK